MSATPGGCTFIHLSMFLMCSVIEKFFESSTNVLMRKE